MRSKIVLAVVASALAAGAAAAAFTAPAGSAAPGRQAGAQGVRLVYFTATRVKKTRTVTVKWRTGSEPDVLGFRLYRVVNKKKARVGKLFASKGATGGIYSFKDLLPKTVKLACYSLDQVSTLGASVTLRQTCMKK